MNTNGVLMVEVVMVLAHRSSALSQQDDCHELLGEGNVCAQMLDRKNA